MFGLAVNPTDLEVAAEFFELFKTPWERAVPGRRYRVVLSTDGCIEGLDADLFLVYGSAEHTVDRDAGIAVEQVNGPVEIEWGEWVFPVYRRAALFGGGSGNGNLQVRGRSLEHGYRAAPSSSVVTAPASPQAPRFFPG